MTSGASPMPIPTEDSVDILPTSDSEPQSLMGVRFACHALENAMPLIMQEVYFERHVITFGDKCALVQYQQCWVRRIMFGYQCL